MSARAQQLLTLGQSVWLDFIRRGPLVSGEFDRQVAEDGVVGVTSNPTIFQQAIAKSTDYDTALAAAIAKGLEGEALFEALAIEDIQMACDRMRAVYDGSKGMDGRVSIEVSPRLAHDSAGTLAAAKRLHAAVARENVMITIPATAAGLPAITGAIAAGISVNVTLIFSLARYAEVMEAYLLGLEQRAAAGGELSNIRSVASFFISRVDSKVDAAIDARAATLPAGSTERAELESLRGKAAVANARLAYAAFESVFGAARFQTLAAKGAHVQRPLWASTSTKNPAYRDVLYVEELIGPDTVNTIPPATLAAFNDHGVVETRIRNAMDEARALFGKLDALGVPVESLIGQLEGEGVVAFEKSYDDLLGAIEARRRDGAAKG
ncbi:MAG: transaldolase [Candidatus Eisenbacteria bacterium]|uniref:Transaldolase n=1 Tax=Eiseniibacteriota bacterium TaxID=2212470 RepID=A0A933SG18_UNCEI|nr:transaldolase [Candidatus Eisenbacteria bacterium]